MYRYLFKATVISHSACAIHHPRIKYCNLLSYLYLLPARFIVHLDWSNSKRSGSPQNFVWPGIQFPISRDGSIPNISKRNRISSIWNFFREICKSNAAEIPGSDKNMFRVQTFICFGIPKSERIDRGSRSPLGIELALRRWSGRTFYGWAVGSLLKHIFLQPYTRQGREARNFLQPQHFRPTCTSFLSICTTRNPTNDYQLI